MSSITAITIEVYRSVKMVKKSQALFPHFSAILFRRVTLLKRSLKSTLTTSVMTLVFSLLAIVANYLMKYLMEDKAVPYTFASFLHSDSGNIVISEPDDGSEYWKEFIPVLEEMYLEDTGKNATIYSFPSREELNEWMYNNALNKTGPGYITMGIGFNKKPGFLSGYNLTAYFNGSWVANDEMASLVTLTRLAWKKEFGSNTDFVFSVTQLMQKVVDFVFGQLAPMLIVCGLISIIPMIVSQPVIDIRGEVRQYMISCSLARCPYWVATFVVDIIIWAILVTVVWAIFLVAQITAVRDNMFNTWYTFMMMGPSFILFVYCLSFLFGSAESATRQLFLILVILLLIPMIVQLITQEETPIWLNYVYGLVPHIGAQHILQQMLVRVNILKQPISYYWNEDEVCMPYLVMQYASIIVYVIVLITIELVRDYIEMKTTRMKFNGYTQFFADIKSRHPVTQEAKDMEEAVHRGDDFAVKIEDVSRLFFNTAGAPIAAVNNVSLGIKENSIFGFLGANGAGKTTLIKMIMSLLPPSSGSIYIRGVDITKNKDPHLLTICPQFNSHLCDEMTPREHFKLYALIHNRTLDKALEESENLISILDLTPHADKPVRELSGGNQRKLAIALSFFGHAKIILLDEPTSSLDPVARHHVHEMITRNRNRRTFMLCTHLLSEAESLCDQISIMIKGCVYTCGTPQYLSHKFGTEYKIDVMLEKDDPNANTKCTAFFEQQLPQAVLTILRPNVRIYSVPSDAMRLSSLFEIMDQGSEGDNGFKYYTCSSSSLERVFMEIVHLSENDDAVYANDAVNAP